jgi:DNA-directed RNA polymerases I, II, and III subunit RPABC1
MDRGYSVSEKECTMSLDDFKERFGTNINREGLQIRFNNEAGEELYVFFTDEPSVGVKTIRG